MAELWFGAPPCGTVHCGPWGSPVDLSAYIVADPASALGEDVRARPGDRLPHLLKIIATNRPLSLQVHPHAQRARAGFVLAEVAGVPVDSAERNCKAPHHRPELVYALTQFEALCEFRAPAAPAVGSARRHPARTRPLSGWVRHIPATRASSHRCSSTPSAFVQVKRCWCPLGECTPT